MWLATFCQLKSIWYSMRNSLAYPLLRMRRGRGSYHRVLVHCCPNTPPPIDGPDWHLDLLLGNPAGPRLIVSTCLTALLKHRHISYPWGLWGKSIERNTSPIECDSHAAFPKSQWTLCQQYQWLLHLPPSLIFPLQSSDLWRRGKKRTVLQWATLCRVHRLILHHCQSLGFSGSDWKRSKKCF